ncbi:MAG: N-acetylmuramoyl-L-alanine amidase [Bifidobacterium tsurumiense]|uniref:N-acetylmuramoyl-L-alanine amidase n=1 Tax=Bifidobacterium tsurumiense TaxID=356829 RepID=UPI002A8022E5|nr:N-acetylmuramoyl-L-alanine amidase [Bifidobacterium tsurumiense]MDY4677575.1 N-acetylmuramoyl-L-alanine amidase [Bifidobacterium tsurumiense]
MKNWETLEADEVRLLSKHFTKGRSGAKVSRIVLHHNAGNLSIEGCWNVWQTREASAHYQVQSDGRIGQLVWDGDTAWHAGNWAINMGSIGIEHADISSSPWRISDECLDNGAHLVAALCKHYGLGRPAWGVNVFPHSQFTSTTCPASIASDQREAYMRRAGEWFDTMNGGAAPSAQVQQSAPASNALVVDGNCGPATVSKWQQVMGTTVDGVISGQVVPSGNYARPNLFSVSYGGFGSQLIRAVQARLGLEQDGLLGPATIRAIQAHLGVAQDASFGPATVSALQTRVNENRF